MRHNRDSSSQQSNMSSPASPAGSIPRFPHTQTSSKPSSHHIETDDTTIASSSRHDGERTSSPTRIKFNNPHPSSGPNPSPPPRPQQRGKSNINSEGSPERPRLYQRAFTVPARRSIGGTATPSSPTTPVRSSGDTRRLSGTVNHRGRHANDWLFGGFSLADQVLRLLRDDGGGHDDAREPNRRESGGRGT